MRIMMSALFALAVMCSPAVAQNIKADATLARDERLVKAVNVEDLKAIIVAGGYKVSQIGPVGPVSVKGTTDEGVEFLLIGAVCDSAGHRPDCVGINMQVRYDADADVTLEKVNKASLTYAATSTWLDTGSKTLGISRYVILDDGVTMANVKANLSNLLAIANRVTDIIWP